MKPMLLVPVLLFAACTESLQPEQTQVVSTADSEHDGASDEIVPRPFTAEIFIDTITCVETIARFEAGARYIDDGTAPANIACLWTFDDGTTSSDCFGEHPFATSGMHDFMLEVTDLSTGAVATSTQTRSFHPPLEATLEVTGDGLTISYRAMSNTGGDQIVFISPSDLVIDADPRDLERTVTVREAGTYTIEYSVEDERGSSEICNARVTKEITLVCDEAAHVH